MKITAEICDTFITAITLYSEGRKKRGRKKRGRKKRFVGYIIALFHTR